MPGHPSTPSHIFEKLGVRKVINAAGCFTKWGGPPMAPEALAAFNEAAAWSVEIDELHRRAGEYIARRVGAEAAYVSSGASGGIFVAVAACLAGTDLERIARLPAADGPNEVIGLLAHKGNGPYHQAAASAGGRVVWIGTSHSATGDDLARAITDRTAVILYMVLYEACCGLSLAETIRVARAHPAGRRIRIIVDAAGELVPDGRFTRYQEMGADLSVFSGGKELRGPQGTGLVLGSKDLIEACRANGSPNDAIGRSLKVSKEEIAALVAAIDRFLERDPQAEWRRWERQSARVAGRLSRVPGVRAEATVIAATMPLRPMIPAVRVGWDRAALGRTAQQVLAELLAGEPRILLHRDGEDLFFNPDFLEEGQEELVAERLAAALSLPAPTPEGGAGPDRSRRRRR